MLRLMSEREELAVVADQVGTPTWAGGLAAALWQFAGRPDLAGIYHWSDAGVCSWYDFALAIFELARLDCQVSPIESSEYPTPAQRPNFSVLNKAKIKAATGISIPHWREALVECLAVLGHAK